ncbi:MAG: peptide transporter [Verrucomicrobia bacterium]|nr:peptide transporter [Verrucomicrobiota bacterium]
MKRTDKELEQYRDLLDVPTDFKNGFGWSTVVGIFFCGLIMLPGSIYLSLMTGGNMGAAGVWVTVILFAQIAKRAMKTMSKQELVVLLHAAGIMVAANAMFPGGPFGFVVYRAYLVTCDAARDAGMMHAFPAWFVPSPDSAAIMARDFFHKDWLIPIALVAFTMFTGFLQRYTLGYVFFRIASDVEKLPFPLAPIAAQGATAMAEMDQKESPTGAVANADPPSADASSLARKAFKKTGSPRWRQFSFGVTMGALFGVIQVGFPAVTGLFLDKPVFLIPQPFIETTPLTEAILPATPTGMALDLGIVLMGMVLPFWAVVGTFTAIVLTACLNPILHHAGVLTHWQPGMDTVNTLFANRMDFWLSFTIGASVGIAVVSLFSAMRDVRRKMREIKSRRAAAGRLGLWDPPREGRGDYPLGVALLLYVVATGAVMFVCHRLVPQVPVSFLIVLGFVYMPFIAYINARMMGIAGQQVDIPFVKESAFMASRAKGIDIWLAPIPVENHGGMAQSFRVNELTGVRFTSLIKADLIALPVLFVLSLVFWAFIWKSGPIPSEAYPYAQINWELAAKENVLFFSSTFVPPGEDPAMRSIADSQLMKQAIHLNIIGSGFLTTVAGFVILNACGLPVMLIYGFVRGLGQIPHIMVLEIVGALIGRYYLRKKYGTQNFLRIIPVILAGYFTGVGLISMATIAMNLIQQAVSGTPF